MILLHPLEDIGWRKQLSLGKGVRRVAPDATCITDGETDKHKMQTATLNRLHVFPLRLKIDVKAPIDPAVNRRQSSLAGFGANRTKHRPRCALLRSGAKAIQSSAGWLTVGARCSKREALRQAGGRLGGTSLRAAGECAPGRWRLPERALEGAVERRLRGVADAARDVEQCGIGGSQGVRSELQPPLREVPHGRRAEHCDKALAQDASRRARAPRESFLAYQSRKRANFVALNRDVVRHFAQLRCGATPARACPQRSQPVSCYRSESSRA